MNKWSPGTLTTYQHQGRSVTSTRQQVISIAGHRARVGEQLRQCEERFRLLVESVVDHAIFMLDPQGRIISWNAGAERIKGYGADEVLGRHFSCLYTPEDVERGKPRHDLELATSTGRFEDEGWRMRKDGSRFRANAVITALRDASGELRGFGKVTRDLTERARALERSEQSEARLLAFFDHSPSLMFIKDLEGRYVQVNERFMQAFGLKRDRVLSRRDSEVFPPEVAGEFEANDARVLQGGAGIEVEETAPYADGSHVSIVCKFPIFNNNGRVFALGGIVTDITERKLAEKKIRELNDDLMRRTAQVESMNKELETFVRTVSHDLRAPLRHMEGSVALLLDELAGVNEAAARLNGIASSAAKLGDLVGELLAYSQASRANARMVPVDLNKIVDDARNNLQLEARSRRIRWNVAKLPVIRGDAALLREVFSNLISNALKFSRDRDQTVIEIGSYSGDGRENVVFVRDNGIGFDPRLAHRLFGMFQRLHPENEYEGTGIGLAMVKRIIECHGGRTWAETTPGLGAAFFISFGKPE